MTDIAIFPFCSQDVIKIESVTLNCDQMNQIDFKTNLSSESSSQSSIEIETEPENKSNDCSIHVMNHNDQQINSYSDYQNDDFNDSSYIYNNDNIELNTYKCNANYQQNNDSNFYHIHHYSNIPWSAEEDEIIRDFIKKDQKFSRSQTKENIQNIWSRLANVPLLLHNKRSAKDIKQRWVLHLDPCAAEERLKGPWTIEEDILLAKLHDIYGNCWNKIASFIPGRTEPSVKTRWNSHLKTKIRSNLESRVSVLSSTAMISTPSKLLNSLFQNEKIEKAKKKDKSDSFQSSCQYLIIDDLDDNYLSENFILDDNDHSLFLETSQDHKGIAYDDVHSESCKSVKSNVSNKEKSFLFDYKMLPQINSPTMKSPFTLFGPWPNAYYSSA